MFGKINSFSPTTIDAYVLHLTQQFESTVLDHYKNYQFRDANTAIYQFCTDTLSSLYLSTIKDRLYCDAATSDQRQRAQITLRVILEVLLRVLSPILPHTCDEALESLTSGSEDSVQGSVALRLENINYDDNWREIMNVRKLVLKELETAKTNGIENSLDAAVHIPNTIPATFLSDLPDLLGVSRVYFSDQNEVRIEDLKDAPRCERSWKRDETVQERADGSILSERDYHAIQQNH